MWHIRKDGNGPSLKLPENFFDQNYPFGPERIKKIKERSGLSWNQFAAALDRKPSVVTSWIANRKKKRSNNPTPGDRLKLAYIEAEQLLQLSKEKIEQL